MERGRLLEFYTYKIKLFVVFLVPPPCCCACTKISRSNEGSIYFVNMVPLYEHSLNEDPFTATINNNIVFLLFSTK